MLISLSIDISIGKAASNPIDNPKSCKSLFLYIITDTISQDFNRRNFSFLWIIFE